MYLESIVVENYRSISKVELNPCRDFNVLIGRNNSGKSNILTSIEVFFQVASPEVISRLPSLGEEIDFFQKDTNRPIGIEATFRISDEERKRLLADIFEEKPQVRNLLDDVGPEARIVVAVSILSPPRGYAYVRNMSLLKAEGSEARQLFEIDKRASKELYDNFIAAQRSDRVKSVLADFLLRFDRDDFSTLKSRQERSDFNLFLRRRFDFQDRDLMSRISVLLNDADTYEKFAFAVREILKAEEASGVDWHLKEISAPIETFSGAEHTVPAYVRNFLGRLNRTKILHFKERRVPIGSAEAKRLLSLKVRRGGTEILSGIQSSVNELLGVDVDAFEGVASPDGSSSAELDVDNFLVQANGSGIREALRLILDTEFEKPQILLVEEPEIHLHPALETSVMSYLRKVSQSQAQVFITTHSTNFLDTGNFQNVFLVSKGNSTDISPLSLLEAEERLPSELGIRLSSLFMYDQIVFVEGPSDEQVIRELARILDINLGQLNVGFIQMRGVRNISHYAAAEVVSFLTKRRVKLWFLVDSDESGNVHFLRLKDDFGDKARVHVLRRRELENYLLSPTANVSHILGRLRFVDDPHCSKPSVVEFSTKIEECADKLKHLAIWKRVVASTRKPFYPYGDLKAVPKAIDEMKTVCREAYTKLKDDMAAAADQIEASCDAAALEIDQKWSEQKLDIVPGSALLDEIYKSYGLRFDKMRDGVAIASYMQRDDIDRELKEFLMQLASRM
ncbi:ATP-dependent nuclease [Bradyrhizobium oligotrophicum]|uniref:ATP-dependent nuclease n=1 Tax=Bradyrhizobium oligotrophicum TaxID=44255 RepID=UPI003EBDB614